MCKYGPTSPNVTLIFVFILFGLVLPGAHIQSLGFAKSSTTGLYSQAPKTMIAYFTMNTSVSRLQ